MISQKTYFKNALAIGAFFILSLLISCGNPYNKIAKRPPITAADSAAILAQCIKIIHADNHDTIENYHSIFDDLNDSAYYFKLQVDSLMQLKDIDLQKIYIDYRDTCKSAGDKFNEGFDVGYKAGLYNGKEQQTKFYTSKMVYADSLCKDQLLQATRKNAQQYEIKIAYLVNQLSIANKSQEKYRNKSDQRGSWMIWLISLSALLLIICILLWKFRRQQKAANNIINDIKNLK